MLPNYPFVYRARTFAFVLCLAVCSEIGHVTPRRGAEAVHARDRCTTLASVEPSSRRSSTLTGCGIGCPRRRHSCRSRLRSVRTVILCMVHKVANEAVEYT
jgi:hypothetical protein